MTESQRTDDSLVFNREWGTGMIIQAYMRIAIGIQQLIPYLLKT